MTKGGTKKKGLGYGDDQARIILSASACEGLVIEAYLANPTRLFEQLLFLRNCLPPVLPNPVGVSAR
jgi:hypothetical protein